jgi:hypothetical protein
MDLTGLPSPQRYPRKISDLGVPAIFLDSVAPGLVIAVACFWLAVWAVCLLLTVRFVAILVGAGVLQTWESWTEMRKGRREGKLTL